MRVDALEHKTVPDGRSSRESLYGKAWTAAMLGFILLVLSFAVRALYWIRWFGMIHGDFDGGDVRSFWWLNSAAGVLHYFGFVLMVAAIIFVIRGLMTDGNRWTSGAILIGTLGDLWALAVVALAIYLVSIPVLVLVSLLEVPHLAALYYAGPELLFLAAMPLIVARALCKGRPLTGQIWGKP